MITPDDLPQPITIQGNQKGIAMAAEEPAGRGTENGVALKDINEIKKGRLIDALRQSGGNQSEAARRLGISRTSVWSQIKRFGIDFSSL
jgi:transcriptional regulator of acetoin/glycerol metabolism